MAWSAVAALPAATILAISSMDTVVDQWAVQLDIKIVAQLMSRIFLIMMIKECFRVIAMVTTSLVYIDQSVIWFIVLKSLCAAL